MHRILGTNYLLSKMNIVNSDKCSFCNEEKETIKHLFWDCRSIVPFWISFQTFIKDNCTTHTIEWNLIDVLFGNPQFEDALNLLILKAKQFIYSMKMKKLIPIFVNFKTGLSVVYRTEEYIAKRDLKNEILDKRWKNFQGLFS